MDPCRNAARHQCWKTDSGRYKSGTQRRVVFSEDAPLSGAGTSGGFVLFFIAGAGQQCSNRQSADRNTATGPRKQEGELNNAHDLVLNICHFINSQHLKLSGRELLFWFIFPVQDPTGLLFLRIVSELMESREEEMLDKLEAEEMGGRERLMRRHINFSQRERKAGCRNFFWKTFTSC